MLNLISKRTYMTRYIDNIVNYFQSEVKAILPILHSCIG